MFRHLSRRFLASTAASASAVSLLGYQGNFVSCATANEKIHRTKSQKLVSKNVDLADFELFHAYQVHFGEDATKPLKKVDVEAILLHCGILDPKISDFLFNSLLAMDKKKAKRTKSTPTTDEGEATVTFSSFRNLCNTFAKGDDKDKTEIIFDFMDVEKNEFLDKNVVSTAVRHLLWCQTNWYGEEVLYDGPHDLDLYFEVPTESIAQLKANKFAHELVIGCHGGGRQMAINHKQFQQWMQSGGKRVETLKSLFSVFGAYEANALANNDNE